MQQEIEIDFFLRNSGDLGGGHLRIGATAVSCLLTGAGVPRMPRWPTFRLPRVARLAALGTAAEA
jgi:hypothetical protein